MVAEGCIHGRFQPFDNEHLENARAAFGRCAFLWIGMAEPCPIAQTQEGPARRLAQSANPLTYFERQFMITRTLVAEGMTLENFSFTPFPVRTPEYLPHYLDPEITCFVTGSDEGNRQRGATLQKLGYPVEILRERKKGTDGSTIRSLLLAGDDSWRDLVPTSVASCLDEFDLAARLRDLQD